MKKNKKSKVKATGSENSLGSIEVINALQYSKECIVEYGTHTLEDRALPDFRDGLKPVHRRILYSTYRLGALSNKPTTKCARIIGECFGAGTLVTTPTCNVAIEHLEIGDLVTTSKGDFKVTALIENPSSPMFMLETSDGRQVSVTPNQEFKVKQGDSFIWKKAVDLTEDDFIVTEVNLNQDIHDCFNLPRPRYHKDDDTKILFIPDLNNSSELSPEVVYTVTKMKSLTSLGNLPNYDITVDTVHEFYAEGLCVKNCLGKLHPHGDSGTYSGLVTMATRMTHPLMRAQGNFGNKITDDGPAAHRYTESGLTKFSETYLLDKDYLACVPMMPNYDGKDSEPVYLPAKLPLSLTQYVEGIATGARTLIPSFSVESLSRTVTSALKKGKATDKLCYDTLEFIFADGGYVDKTDDLKPFFKTGTGKVIVKPLVKYDEKNNAIKMYSYTPQFKLSKVLESALDVSGVVDVEDLTSTKNGISILFYIKKSATKKEITSILEEIRNKYSASLSASIMITLRHDNGTDVSFKYASPTVIINDWIEWRLSFEKTYVKRLIALEKEKIGKLNWLLWAISNKKLVYAGLETKQPEEFLVKKGKIKEDHAKFIYDLALRRLSKLSEDQLKSDLKSTKQLVTELSSSIATDKSTRTRVIKQLKELS